MRRFAILFAVGLLGAAGASHAQEVSHRLGDGRTITVAARTEGCEDRHAREHPDFAIAFTYGCGVAGSGQDGEGSLIVAHEPGTRTPLDYLMGHAEALLPDADDQARRSLIDAVDLPTRTGAVRFLCLWGQNAAATGGTVICVLDQPTVQVLLGTESYDIERAANTLSLILGGVSIR